VFESAAAVRPAARFFIVSALAHAAAILVLLTIRFPEELNPPERSWRVGLIGHVSTRLAWMPFSSSVDRETLQVEKPRAIPVALVPQEATRELPVQPHVLQSGPVGIETPAIITVEPMRSAASEVPNEPAHEATHEAPYETTRNDTGRSVKTGGFSGGSILEPHASAERPLIAKLSGFTGVDILPPHELSRRQPHPFMRGSFDAVSASPEPGANSSVRHLTLAAGGFANPSIAARKFAAPSSAPSAETGPVEILFKPHPIYSPEARALRIEGEVLVEIQFSASGGIRILRIVQGLGHGLDESAVAAAREIRFRPAREGGVSVDATALVHFQFQLAY
jgi:TonB family protein